MTRFQWLCAVTYCICAILTGLICLLQGSYIEAVWPFSGAGWCVLLIVAKKRECRIRHSLERLEAAMRLVELKINRYNNRP